jgi:hypothetical protein
MTDRPVTKSSSTETPKAPAESGSPIRNPAPAPSGVASSSWPTWAALGLAVVATVLAALAYFMPMHHQASVPQQSGDAKANVCSAYKAAHRSVVVNTHMQSRNPNDAVAELSVATNARLALIGGGAYLKDRLAANTGAPADIADAINSFANTIEQLGTNYLIGAGPEAQDPLRKDLDAQIAAADKLCS